jgi:phosphonatase-like hydrolase
MFFLIFFQNENELELNKKERMKPVELVVFDMAGTTIKDNKEVESCFAEACLDTGLDVSAERIQALQGYAKLEVFKTLFEDQVYFSYNTFKEILEDHYLASDILPTDFCLETFKWLKQQHIKIALTTGFYRKVANIILDKVGWLHELNENYLNENGQAIIDLSLTPDEVKKGRPAPDMILKAMETFGITDSKKVVKIGDTPVDLATGINSNCLLSMAVCNGTHSRNELAVFKNDGLLENLSELPFIIEQLHTSVSIK